MRLERLDDYQSWLLELDGWRVAIDPWLRASYSLAPGPWVLERRRDPPRFGPEQLATIDALAFTAPFEDHLDPASLAAVPRGIPVLAPRPARATLRRLGFSQVLALAPLAPVTLGGALRVRVVPSGFPFTGIAHGYLWEHGDTRLYHEPHAIAGSTARALGPVDAVMTAVQGVRLLGLPLVMAPESLLVALELLRPARVISTGDEPQRATGLLQRLLRTHGTLEGFAQRLASRGLACRFERLAPGASLALSDLLQPPEDARRGGAQRQPG